MGAIEDMRKVLQDFLAPELRALHERLGGLDKRMDGLDKRIDEFRTDLKADIAELRGEMRGELRAQAEGFRSDMKGSVSYIVSQLQLDARLGKLEEENQRRKQLPDKQ